MRQLALVSMVFLPITFVAGGNESLTRTYNAACLGSISPFLFHSLRQCFISVTRWCVLYYGLLVYGTNFTDFPELSHNIGYFWFICLSVTILFVST